MAFPRSFKRELWYLRLPSGETEIVTASALQRSFACGLVDVRTPVRAFGAHTWTTMMEAAQLEAPTSPSSLAPIAVDPPASDLADDALWRTRNDLDPAAFKPSKAPFVLGFLGAAAVALAVFVSGGPPKGVPLEQRVVAASALSALSAPVIDIKPTPAPIREMLRTPKFGPKRFSKEERHRLLELDYLTRITKPKQMSRTPLGPPRKSKTAPDDPFNASGRRGDPLDGAI